MSFNKLEEYFDNNTDIYEDIITKYKEFGYENKEEFTANIDLMCYVYNKNILGMGDRRLNQQNFRENLELEYTRCIISNQKPFDACHIIPVNNNGEYSIYNGILLRSDLHRLFDDYTFSICHITGKILINHQKAKNTSILDFQNIIVNQNIIINCSKSLEYHNQIFYNLLSN
jgi:hypothetical protein